jgi:hypothetical protein
MKHSIDELLDVVHRHYPPRIPTHDPRYATSEEHQRLVAARKQAGAEQAPWRALLLRLDELFPGNDCQNRSLHLPTGQLDACYSGSLHLPKIPGEGPHWLGFFVSFLVPYFIVYSSQLVDDPEAMGARRPAKENASLRPAEPETIDLYLGNTMIVLPAEDVTPELSAELEKLDQRRRERHPETLALAKTPAEQPRRRQAIRFDFSPDEEPYAAGIAREIETLFGCERMPPEIGNVIVGDVETNERSFWKARIYDCLMSDNW